MAIYLKINGIQGSVSTKGYERSIEIAYYQLKANRHINHNVGVMQNRTSGILNYSGIELSKQIDKATVVLLQHFYQSNSLPKLEFHHVTTGSELQCYLINTFYDVLISGYEETHGSDATLETLHLHFSGHEKRFTPLDASNKATSPQTVGFDLTTAEMI